MKVMDHLKTLNFDQKTVFIIDSRKSYFLIRCFLLSKNILFFDEFIQEDRGFKMLYQFYQDEPSDENFLNVLSHPLCEQHNRFIEIEKYFEFPKRSFKHFELTQKEIFIEKQNQDIFVFLLKEAKASKESIKNIDHIIFTSEWSYA